MTAFASLTLDVGADGSVRLIRAGMDSFGSWGGWFVYADGSSQGRQFWVPMSESTCKRLCRYMGEEMQLVFRPVESVYDA